MNGEVCVMCDVMVMCDGVNDDDDVGEGEECEGVRD